MRRGLSRSQRRVACRAAAMNMESIAVAPAMIQRLSIMRSLAAAAAAGSLSCFPAPLSAQCAGNWLPGNSLPGTDDRISAAVMWDPDGAGPATPVLVLGGDFTLAGNVSTQGIATWDPATGAWGTLGGGIPGQVMALAVLPTGELVLAGITFSSFYSVHRWSGSAWVQVGPTFDSVVWSLAVANGDLVAGGAFANVGGVPANRVARWTGTAWLPLGNGIPTGSVRHVLALANGDIAVGGAFLASSGAPGNCVARWDGVAWSAFGAGIVGVFSDGVRVLAQMPNGDLVAGGFFTNSGGSPSLFNIARWNGASWSPLGTGTNSSFSQAEGVRSLLALPNGDLIVGGAFTIAGAVVARSIARWNGSSWSALGAGFPSFSMTSNPVVHALVQLPNGELLATGTMIAGGTVAGDRVSRWDGTAWRSLTPGFNNRVFAAAGTAQGEMVVGGSFTQAGDVAASRIARWNGTAWSALGVGVNGTVLCVVALPGGGYAIGGSFSSAGGLPAFNLARWNGTTWAAYGPGLSNTVRALAVMANGDLVAVGDMLSAGSTTVNYVARWNGSAWSAVGNGVNGLVYAAHVRPNGDLVVSGSFTQAGGVAANGIARWNGSAWSTFGTGLPQCGEMTTLANGDLVAIAGSGVQRWNGSAWAQLGANFDIGANSLTQLPGGDLVVGGNFTTNNGSPVQRLARWHGSAWTQLGSGFDDRVWRVQATPAGELIVAGQFVQVGAEVAPYLARYAAACPASAIALGAGCPSSGGSNTLTVTALPWLGNTMRMLATGLPGAVLAASVTGFTPTLLPLASVFATGQSGCNLLVTPDLVDTTVASGGTVQPQLAIPASAALIGQSFHQQVIPFEITIFGIGAITATNALTLTIGSF